MLKKILTYIQEHQQKKADYLLLVKMSDRELSDIGISRGEIYSKIWL